MRKRKEKIQIRVSLVEYRNESLPARSPRVASGKSGPPPVSTIVEKRDTCRPRGRDDTRSNRFGGVATHKCVYLDRWHFSTSDKSPPSLVGRSRKPIRAESPALIVNAARWHHVHVNDPQKRNRISCWLRPGGSRDKTWRDTAPEWQLEGKITGDSRRDGCLLLSMRSPSSTFSLFFLGRGASDFFKFFFFLTLLRVSNF